MNAGKLRNLVTIEQKSLGTPTSASAERGSSWQLLQQQYAAIHPLSGKEMAYAQSYADTASHRITTRYVPALVGIEPATFRVVWNGRLYAVNAILEGDMETDTVDCRSRWLTLLCTQYFDPQDSESVGNPQPVPVPLTTEDGQIVELQ